MALLGPLPRRPPDAAFTTSVEQALSEVVRTDGRGYRTLDYAKITAFLIEVAKAQQREIEELRRQVQTLQSRREAERSGSAAGN